MLWVLTLALFGSLGVTVSPHDLCFACRAATSTRWLSEKSSSQLDHEGRHSDGLARGDSTSQAISGSAGRGRTGRSARHDALPLGILSRVSGISSAASIAVVPGLQRVQLDADAAFCACIDCVAPCIPSEPPHADACLLCRLLEAAKQASPRGRTACLPPCRSACSQALLLPSLQAFRLQTRVRL